MESIIKFLSDLEKNNSREWFETHKSRYLTAKKDFEQLIGRVLAGLQEFDAGLRGVTPKDAIFRIYRDVRFSHDKSPYKTNMGAYMVAGGKKSGRGGYYLHLDPAGCFMAGGIYEPHPDYLKKIRREIYHFPEEFLEIINRPELSRHFSLYDKNLLKRPPQGFEADFAHMDLLKYKHYVLMSDIDLKWLYDSDVERRIVERFRITHPLNEFLNRAIDHAE